MEKDLADIDTAIYLACLKGITKNWIMKSNEKGKYRKPKGRKQYIQSQLFFLILFFISFKQDEEKKN